MLNMMEGIIMRKFNVTVNGNLYEVEVEEIGGVQNAAPVRSSAPVAAPAQVVAEAKKPAAPVNAAGGDAVKAPMPGTILDVKVKVGDAVKAGQAVCVLEAMKMENEIPASKDGKILAVLTQKGASVEVGTPLVTIG